MAKETLAILGAKGMLGTDLVQVCQSHYDVTELDLPDFDITDYRRLADVVKNHHAIINCAAYTDVDGAETHQDEVFAVNALAVGKLGRLATVHDRWVLHFSTDFVFDGTLDRPYRENDPTHPINAYGVSKLLGERLLLESHCRSCIIRIEWTYGHAGRNFVTKLLQRARRRQPLKVVDDQVGSPTATSQVARAACELLNRRPEGIFHFAADGYVSRYEMAKFIVENLSLDVEVVPCKTADFHTPAKRPLNSRFDCSKIKKLLGRPVEPWQKPLLRFLRQL